MRQIGVAVGMSYSAKASGAKSSDAIDIFTNWGLMNMTKNKAQIKNTLKNYSGGIVFISSRIKKDNWNSLTNGFSTV